MSVTLNPSNSLGFRRPLTTLVKRSLTITNNNSQPVAFKVKTTAPKLYCVRPNSGRVEPGESVDVAVMLQALKEEPPLNTKCKDKFLIQSTIITPDKETLPLNEIWSSPDLTPEEGKVFSQKLRVAYLPAEGQIEEEEEHPVLNESVLSDTSAQFETVRNPTTNGLPTLSTVLNSNPIAAPVTQVAEPTPRPASPPRDHVEREPSYDIVNHESVPSTDPGHVPPRTPSPHYAHADLSLAVPEPVTAPASAAESTYEQPYQPPVIPVPEPAPAPAPVPPAPAPVIIHKENPVNEQLYAKLKTTEAENEKLRHELEEVLRRLQENESELLSTHRKRERVSSDADSIAASDAQTVLVEETPIHQDGVPPQVVVLIAVGVFVMTYLFF